MSNQNNGPLDEEETNTTPEEQEFLRSLNLVLRKLEDIPYESFCADLDKVEASFIAKFPHEPVLILEAKRRIAEWKLVAAEVYGQSIEHAEILLNYIESIGWTDLEIRALKTAVFTRHCITMNRPDVGRRYLQPVIAELEIEVTRSGELWARNHLAACRRLLAELEQKELDQQDTT